MIKINDTVLIGNSTTKTGIVLDILYNKKNIPCSYKVDLGYRISFIYAVNIHERIIE